MTHQKNLFLKIYLILLIGFTGYILLDTFVITRVYENVEENIEENNQEEMTNDNITSTDSMYKDDNIEITIKEYREKNTDIYVADIKLSSSEYLKTAFAQNAYGKNVVEKTSVIAQENNAILAINGDYYGVQEKGYVLKNGNLYRKVKAENRSDLVIYKNGDFAIIEEDEISAEDLLESNVYHLLSFGPSLVENGHITVNTTDEVDKSMTSNPRTAIGIIDELHYIFVVSDGRTTQSEGLSLYELASFMKDLNVNIAYNLDGGGSSTMYFNGKVINNPTTSGKSIKERKVSDIVYVGY